MDEARPANAGAKPKAWVGVDAGKAFHWAVMIDSEGENLISRRVENEESDLSKLLEEALASGFEPIWAVDQIDGGAALLLALLWERAQEVLHVPGVAVDRARDAHRGESKTDARDARLIADQARMRRDLSALEPGDELLTELAILTARRRDLVTDKTRAVNRLRGALLALFPGLERALDLNQKGALVLVSRYQTPEALRRSGRKRVEGHLRSKGVQGAAALAEKAVAAAKGQRVRPAAQGVAAVIVASLAAEVLALKERVAALDDEIGRRFCSHPLSGLIASLPGMGTLLGAEFLAAAGDLSAFKSAGHLAAYAGLVPAANDSGKRVGNNRRMRGGNKTLKRVFYQSAFASLRTTPASKAFYDRKRSEGKRHTQALIALARRRVNVLWAMLRDGERFRPVVTT
jgi:transposase